MFFQAKDDERFRTGGIIIGDIQMGDIKTGG